MSKFNYEMMGNEDISVVCYNKEKYTAKQALESAKSELSLIDEDNELEVFSSYVQYGYCNYSGEVHNGWFIKDIYEPVIKSYVPKKNEVEVWVVREVEDIHLC